MRPTHLRRLLRIITLTLLPLSAWSQVTNPAVTSTYYLFHASGNALVSTTESRAALGGQTQRLQFVSDGAGYYWIKSVNQQKYLALSGNWDTYFVTDSTTNASKYAIEKVTAYLIRLKCKANGLYLGTDNTTVGSNVYSDKSGMDIKHQWYISDKVITIPIDTAKYLINPNAAFTKSFDGWGVSLCWWANMCGEWSDSKIDQIVDWLVSPTGLNFSIFRYNIGGGDDPLNRNCTPHHMGNGKGLRAEMDGFKDSANADYNWSRDAAQRKIMLKIKLKRPDAIFEAFSNSPPYYMTYSGCCAGNTPASSDNLKPENYQAFAQYLVDVCKFYKDSFNIAFKTLAPFNEPNTSYWGANGGQEGCHFGVASQFQFLKVIAPVLKASGLKTILSASDETSVASAVTGIKAFAADAAVLGSIGQINTHTYSASNQARVTLRALSTAYDKTLWMSEVGSGGSGISGNLALAQKLMDDIRYIQPEAWIDWQYMEELNDQWCMVRGSFANQTYQRVKNYYVRQQVSRYIHRGSRFLLVPNEQMLAALSPSGDSLVLVTLNNSSQNALHQIDMRMINRSGQAISATRTSETENNTSISNFVLKDSNLVLNLPPYSITTLVIPIFKVVPTQQVLQTGIPYLILPRPSNMPLRSTEGNVSIDAFVPGNPSQLWTLTKSGNGFKISNLAGRTLTDVNSYNLSASTQSNLSGQTFTMEPVGDGYYKVLSQLTGKAFDLSGESTAAGTAVGLYAYGTNPAVVHRQWMFALPPKIQSSIPSSLTSAETKNALQLIDAGKAIGIKSMTDNEMLVTVYNIAGKIVFHKHLEGSFTSIPVQPGVYIVSCMIRKGSARTIHKIHVR